MNYKLLLGCLCIGSGLSSLYFRFRNAIHFGLFDIVVLVISLVAGIYFISKGRAESRKLEE
jgi:hypothetical protein